MLPKKNGPAGSGRRLAALSKGGRTKTADGFELVMGENYFGHVLLNHLLLDIVKRAGDSRTVQTLQGIVTVISLFQF